MLLQPAFDNAGVRLVWLSVSMAACALQALLHLLLDLSETGVTLAILWRCLAAFRPLALGWFPLALRPLRRWLFPVIGASQP